MTDAASTASAPDQYEFEQVGWMREGHWGYDGQWVIDRTFSDYAGPGYDWVPVYRRRDGR